MQSAIPVRQQLWEGVGDHGCEYMTGGRVVVLGKTGKNFAAGMSGGVAYVLDEDNDLYLSVNKQLVNIEHVTAKMDVEELKTMIEEHVAYTNSEIGKKFWNISQIIFQNSKRSFLLTMRR